MKIPTWFVIGCGLLVMNLILVLGGTLSRHASAETPDATQTGEQQTKSETVRLSDEEGLPFQASPTGSLPAELPGEPIGALPKVPSLEIAAPTLGSTLPGDLSPSLPNIISLEEVKNAADELRPSSNLGGPLDAVIKASQSPVSEQLSHSFFESMKLRLKTVEHLNQSAIGLVDEAAILYQRGEIAEAQKLLGVATQLRETTARLLVTHQ